MIFESTEDMSNIFQKKCSVGEFLSDYTEFYIKSEQYAKSGTLKSCKVNLRTNYVTEIDEQSCHNEVTRTMEHQNDVYVE